MLSSSFLGLDDLLQMPFDTDVCDRLQRLVDLGHDRLGRPKDDRGVDIDLFDLAAAAKPGWNSGVAATSRRRNRCQERVRLCWCLW